MTHTPTEQANIDVIRKLFEAEAASDWDAYFALWADDCVVRAVGQPTMQGRVAFQAFADQLRSGTLSAFSQFSHTILELTAEGENVVFRWRFNPVLRATGETVSWEGLHWMKVRDGRICEDWNYADPAEVQGILAEALGATR